MNQNGPNQHLPEDNTRRIGFSMMIGFMVLGLALMTYFFGEWEQSQSNPNTAVNSIIKNGHIEVTLYRNRAGHYIAPGTINGKPVSFLLDTGATYTSIPGNIANLIGLKRGPEISANTANGIAVGYLTQIDTLTLGGIQFKKIRGDIAPGYKSSKILLGMNVLKQLEMIQKGNKLILRQKQN